MLIKTFSSLRCRLSIFPVKLPDIVVPNKSPPIGCYVVDVDGATRISITMSGMKDGTTTQLNGLLHTHVVPVTTIQDAVGKSGARANREALAFQASPVAINIEKSWSLWAVLQR